MSSIIAIDPDVNKSGVALLEVETRKLEVSCLTFPQLLDYLRWAQQVGETTSQALTVVVEAGWLHSKSNFHGQQGGRAQRIAKNVGANHETGRKIVEMCQHYGINVVEQAPLRKSWKGRDNKITHEELAQLTGLMGRTNQDARDAALLAWTYANLPMRVRSVNF